MEIHQPQSDEHQQAEGRAHWARPMLTYLGNLRDIVHGFGKTGTSGDSDPQGTFKSGVG